MADSHCGEQEALLLRRNRDSRHVGISGSFDASYAVLIPIIPHARPPHASDDFFEIRFLNRVVSLPLL